MVQGAFPGEVQRWLIADDICGLTSLEAGLAAKHVHDEVVVYQFVLLAGAPVVDCLGPDGVPCSSDDRAAPCLAAGGAFACPANAACPGLGLQSNSGAAPLYTIDVFKGGNPRGSLAITDNVYDVAGVVNGVPLEILGSDIYTNLGPNAGTPGRPIEVLNFDGVPQGVPLPSEGSPDAGTINPELDLAWPEADCNGNNEPDQFEISDGTADDCNGNGIPDECEADCNNNGTADLCDLDAGDAVDCNGNYIPDSCDIAGGTSLDTNGNGIPDECEVAPGACCIPDGRCIETNSVVCVQLGGELGPSGSECVNTVGPVGILVDPFIGPCLLWVTELINAVDYTAAFEVDLPDDPGDKRYTVLEIDSFDDAVHQFVSVGLHRIVAAPSDFAVGFEVQWTQGGNADQMAADLSLRDAGGTEYATVRIMDDSSAAAPRAEGEIEGSGTVTGASFGTSGTSTLRLEVQQIAAGTWQITARVDGVFLLSNVSTRQPDRIELRVRRAGDPVIPFGTVSLDHVVFGAQAPCPWDCGGDNDQLVGIVDFLALLAQWSQVGTSCDFDGGGVSIVDFLALLANWGACP